MVSTDQITTPLPDPVVTELHKRIEKSGTQKVVASELEISESFLTEILKGRRTASPSLLEKLGFVRITLHVKSEQADSVVRAIQKATK